MATMTACTIPDPTRAENALAERLFDATIHTLELFGIYLGRRLGLYRTLAEHGPLTAAGLAETAGIAERYAREWLEQQAVGGFLGVDDVRGAADERRYHLPAGHAPVLADDVHPSHLAPFAELMVGVASALPEVVTAYRTGGGVSFARFGSDMRHGQAAINRPAFVHDLASSWIPALPDVHRRLTSTPPARVADVGCGVGWSTIELARAYPHADVVGYDLDEASIDDARGTAAREGVRARFEHADAVRIAGDGPFDLIVIIEALHDMSRPAEVLATLRGALAPGGVVLVGDERVADRFTAPGDRLERMMYGWSVSHCLPAAMHEQPSAATGTVLRADMLRACAREAGFTRVEVLDVAHELLRFYRLEG
jgi:2-polyprenyl-3-methyl-5-hydroxy-6-metoxy-1,4-benzoquinol methylase